jgi:hypothetical protein
MYLMILMLIHLGNNCNVFDDFNVNTGNKCNVFDDFNVNTFRTLKSSNTLQLFPKCINIKIIKYITVIP